METAARFRCESCGVPQIPDRTHRGLVAVGADAAFWLALACLFAPVPAWARIALVVFAIGVGWYSFASHKQRHAGVCPDCGGPLVKVARSGV